MTEEELDQLEETDNGVRPEDGVQPDEVEDDDPELQAAAEVADSMFQEDDE